MSDVKNYEVVESFEIEGVAQEVGAKVKLTEEQAAELGDKVKPCEATE